MMYQLVFTDMLNQRVIGGQYKSFSFANYWGRLIVGQGKKSSWQIIRTSDNVVLAQSK